MARPLQIATTSILALALAAPVHAGAACAPDTVPVELLGKVRTNAVSNSGDVHVAPSYRGLDFGHASDRTLNTLGTATLYSSGEGIDLHCAVRSTIMELDPAGFPTVEARSFAHLVCPAHAQLDVTLAATVTFVPAKCAGDAYHPAPHGMMGEVQQSGSVIGVAGALDGAHGSIELRGTTACGRQELNARVALCLAPGQLTALRAER